MFMNGRDARAVVVNHLGRQILARPALADEQDRRGRARRNPLQQGAQRLHRGGVSHDPVQGKRLGMRLLEPPDLPPELGRFERLLHEQRDFVQVERLVRVVEGPLLHRLDGRLHAGNGRQHDDGHVGLAGLDLAQHLEAVGIGQPIVEQHEIHGRTALREGFLGCRRLEHLVPLLREPLGQRPTDQLLVVYNEDSGSHRSIIWKIEGARAPRGCDRKGWLQTLALA
jgi:hypothetical protein